MSVLVVYATVEGQSRKIAEFAADFAKDAGHETVLFDASDEFEDVSFDGVDKVVLVAPVHERRHPKHFEVLLSGQKEALTKRPTCMLSVSLSAAFPAGMEEAQDYLDEMKLRTGFEPGMEMLVPGAVRQMSYDYYESQVLRHIVLRDRDYDANKGDKEFTDWEALRKTLTKFLNG